jgi:hypothetical protein
MLGCCIPVRAIVIIDMGGAVGHPAAPAAPAAAAGDRWGIFEFPKPFRVCLAVLFHSLLLLG